MDLSEIATKLGLSDCKLLVPTAAELRRLCDVHFDSNVIGVGEVCKAVICLEIAATRLSEMSDKAYIRAYNSLHNGLCVKLKLDVRELAIQFGCVRVRDGLKLYEDRFLSSLPASRRASADFTRPVFTAVAFYLCAKKHKLKVNKLKLIELCGTSESEFSSVSTSMKDLCHDVFRIAKEKKYPREICLMSYQKKRNLRTMVLCLMMGQSFQVIKHANKWKKHDNEKWKSSVVAFNNQNKTEGIETLASTLRRNSGDPDLEAM